MWTEDSDGVTQFAQERRLRPAACNRAHPSAYSRDGGYAAPYVAPANAVCVYDPRSDRKRARLAWLPRSVTDHAMRLRAAVRVAAGFSYVVPARS